MRQDHLLKDVLIRSVVQLLTCTAVGGGCYAGLMAYDFIEAHKHTIVPPLVAAYRANAAELGEDASAEGTTDMDLTAHFAQRLAARLASPAPDTVKSVSAVSPVAVTPRAAQAFPPQTSSSRSCSVQAIQALIEANFNLTLITLNDKWKERADVL